MFRHHCVILGELVVSTLPSYTSVSNVPISRPVRCTFFPEKFDLNLICVLCTEGKVLFPNINTHTSIIQHLYHEISNVCEWVKNSWQRVKSETIVKSFKQCGISNGLDGSEDYILYEESDESSENSNEDDFSGSDDDFLGFYDE